MTLFPSPSPQANHRSRHVCRRRAQKKKLKVDKTSISVVVLRPVKVQEAACGVGTHFLGFYIFFSKSLTFSSRLYKSGKHSRVDPHFLDHRNFSKYKSSRLGLGQALWVITDISRSLACELRPVLAMSLCSTTAMLISFAARSLLGTRTAMMSDLVPPSKKIITQPITQPFAKVS